MRYGWMYQRSNSLKVNMYKNSFMGNQCNSLMVSLKGSVSHREAPSTIMANPSCYSLNGRLHGLATFREADVKSKTLRTLRNVREDAYISVSILQSIQSPSRSSPSARERSEGSEAKDKEYIVSRGHPAHSE